MPSLDQLISSSRQGVERRRNQRPLADLEAVVDKLAPIHPFTEWVGGDEISFVIRMSGHDEPSLPPFGDADVSGLAGARELIEAASGDTELPFLLTDSHDLVVDPYQLFEARVCGAGGVVLVAAAFDEDDDDSALAELYDLAVELGLDVVLDVGHEDEIERVMELLDPDSFIIRNRKDGGKEADFERTFSLLEEVPAGKVVLSHGGIREPEQVAALERAGVDAAILGPWVLKTDVGETIQRLRGHR
jgi:indole-3-glycerol phosphate synthase